MARVFNFSPGPAAFPEEVLQQLQSELPDWRGTGMSVMEMSHRSREFMDIADQARRDIRDLLEIPEEYRVLFLQGGASGQFSAVPMNLLGNRSSADYVNTGSWSRKAIKEGGQYCHVNIAAECADTEPFTIPPQARWRQNTDAAYLHYTPNETISGVEFHWVPDSGEIPLVADMSSTLLSRPVDIGRYGLIYAGAQKNIGPAGLVIVIVRDDLLERVRPGTPAIMNYQVQASADSMANTPPTFSWYAAGLVFQWLKRQGGLSAMAERNRRKAEKLYAYVDASDFYHNPVAVDSRSWMNIPFILHDTSLNDAFVKGAEEAGLSTLKGHRSVGGMRASLYNALNEYAVDALIDYMKTFERRFG